MGHARHMPGVTWLVFTIAAGCHSAPKPAAVPVVVIDAETRAPVPGAAVRLWSPGPSAPNLGPDAAGTTGADGVARVRAAAADDVGVIIGVTAPGYLPEESDFRASASHALHASPADGRPSPAGPEPIVVEVFAGPRPTVELVVPTGYTGLVKAEVRVQNPPPAPGQREFRFVVGPSGEVLVAGPAVFTHGLGPDFRAHYADGTPLPMTGKGLDLGFRWLKREGDVQFFVVGTEADYTAARRMYIQDSPSPRGGGGQAPGGRGGRRGGRGGGGGGGGGGSGGYGGP